MTAFDRPTTANEACTHPRVTHVHGTYACYVLDKCRCTACSPVAVAYSREESRRKVYRKYATDDRYEPYVDTARARAHVMALTAAGLGYKQIAARAGLGCSSVGALVYPTPSRGRDVREKITRRTEARILAVRIPGTEELAPGARTDAIPTRNRLQALGRMGYSVRLIARIANLDRQRLFKVMGGHPTTTVETHSAVRKVYSQLWRTPCEPDEWRAKAAASRTRRHAIEQQWPSPLELDDDGYLETVEDDDTQTRGADLDDWKHLVLAGEHPARAARRCGVGIDAIEQQARRTDRADVLQLISRSKVAA